MSLRARLIALSLLTLLLPWSGWMLLQELERYLRDTQEGALLASARTMAGAIPLEFQTQLLFAPDLQIPMRGLALRPALDGYDDDWPDPGQGLDFHSPDGSVTARFLAGDHDGRLYLFLDVTDRGASRGDIALLARNPRGLFSFLDPDAVVSRYGPRCRP